MVQHEWKAARYPKVASKKKWRMRYFYTRSSDWQSPGRTCACIYHFKDVIMLAESISLRRKPRAWRNECSCNAQRLTCIISDKHGWELMDMYSTDSGTFFTEYLLSPVLFSVLHNTLRTLLLEFRGFWAFTERNIGRGAVVWLMQFSHWPGG